MVADSKETENLRRTVDFVVRLYGDYEDFYQAMRKENISVPTRDEVYGVMYPLITSGLGPGGGFPFNISSIFEPSFAPAYIPPRNLTEGQERLRQQQVRQFNAQIMQALNLIQNIQEQRMVPQRGVNDNALRLINQFIIDNFGTYQNFYTAATERGYVLPREQPTVLDQEVEYAVRYFMANPVPPPHLQARPIDPRMRFHGFEEWSARGRQEVESRNQARADREQEARERLQEIRPLEPIEEKYGRVPEPEMKQPEPEMKQPEPPRNEFMESFKPAGKQNAIVRLIVALLTPPEKQSISAKRQVIARVPVNRVSGANWESIKKALISLEGSKNRRSPVVTPIIQIMNDMGFPPISNSNPNESMVAYYNRVFSDMPTPRIEEFVNRVLDSLRQTLPEVGDQFTNFDVGQLSGEAPQVMLTFDLENNYLRDPIIDELVRLKLSREQAVEIYSRLSRRLLIDRINSYNPDEDYRALQEQSRQQFFREIQKLIVEIEQMSRIRIKPAELAKIFNRMREGFNIQITLQNIPEIVRSIGENSPLVRDLEQRIMGNRPVQPNRPNRQPIDANQPNPDQVYEALMEMFGSQQYNIVNLPQIIVFQEPPPRGLDPIPEGDEPPNDPDPPIYNIGIGAVNNRRWIRGVNPRTLGIILSILVALGTALKTIYMIIEAIREEHTEDDSGDDNKTKPSEPTPSFPNTPNRPDWLAPRDTIDYNTGTVIAAAPRNREDIKNILKEFNPTNINNVKPMTSLAPITAQILPNSGGTVQPRQATTIEYNDSISLRPMGTKQDDVFINTIRPVENKPFPTKDTWDSGTYPSGSIPMTDITLKPSNTIDNMNAGIRDIDKFDYDKIGDLQLYIYETQQKVKSGKYSKEENDYMTSEITKAASMIKSLIPNQGIYNRARDTMYDQDLVDRTKNYYDSSISLEQNITESAKQYEAELAKLRMMLKDPMFSRNDISQQKNYVDELKAGLTQTKTEYDNNLKVIAYGGDLKSNLSIPNEYFPKTVDDAVKFNQIQQLERGLMKDFSVNADGSYKPKTSVPDAAKPSISAYDQYQKIVRNMPYSDKYYDARLAELQKQYQKNNLMAPDVKTITIAPITELITDDADANVEFNRDVDIRNDEGSSTLRASVKNPAEVQLFLEDNATAKQQQIRWESFSRVAPGHGLGTMAFNTLRQHNARSDAKRFSHTLQDAPYNPTLVSQTGKPMPTQRELQDLESQKNRKFSIADHQRFIPVIQNDYGRASWEEDGFRANKLMSSNFTPERISSNAWSDYDNAKSIYHPELALHNSLYRKDVIASIPIKEMKEQGYYIGLPNNIRPSQQSNILIGNDKTGINYSPTIRNDCFTSNQRQTDNLDMFKQPIKMGSGLIKKSKVFSEFS